jgi:CheY-like chemotaxis protein
VASSDSPDDDTTAGLGRHIAHRINNLLSPAALYLDAVLARESQLGERSREQLLSVQTAIEQVSRELEALQGKPWVLQLSNTAAANPVADTPTPVVPLVAVPDSMEGLRVLLVDDDPLLLASLSRTLGFDGHAVSCAAGGEAGLDQAAQASDAGLPFDVAITDLSMQGMDGLTLAKRLKERLLTRHVVLLTGWGHAPDAQGSLPDHVDQLLAKPPRLSALRSALGKVPKGR